MRADGVPVIVINGLTQIRASASARGAGLITGVISLGGLVSRKQKQARVKGPTLREHFREGQRSSSTCSYYDPPQERKAGREVV